MKKIAILILVFLVVGVGIFSYYFFVKKAETGNQTKRQAVFLTNGQVYFGHITKVDNNFVTIEKIFYLKTQEQLNESSDSDTADKKIALIKLGEELHGPEDNMKISRQNILYFENMREDSRINQAIENYLAKK